MTNHSFQCKGKRSVGWTLVKDDGFFFFVHQMSDSFDNGTTEWFVCSPLGLTAEREQGPYQANAAINAIQLNNCSQNKQSHNMDCLVSISLQLANSRQRTLEFEWFVYNSHCCCTLELPMSFIKKKMGDRVDSRCRGGMIILLFSFLSG